MEKFNQDTKPNPNYRKKFFLEKYGTTEQIEKHKVECPEAYYEDPEVIKKRAEYWNSVYKEQKPFMISHNRAWEIYNESCKLYDSNFDIKINHEFAELVMWYIFKDDRFLNSKLIFNKPSFDKSLMFIGSVGTGKTMILTAMSKIRNVPNPILGRIVSENKIVAEKEVKPYFLHNLIIDDLGTNDEVDSFNGRDKVENIKLLLEQRYFLFKEKKKKTHFSTNKKVKGGEDG